MQVACPSNDRVWVGEQQDKCFLHWRRNSVRTKDRPTSFPTPYLSLPFSSVSLIHVHRHTALTCCLHVGMEIKCGCNSVKGTFSLALFNGNSDMEGRKWLKAGGGRVLVRNVEAKDLKLLLFCNFLSKLDSKIIGVFFSIHCWHWYTPRYCSGRFSQDNSHAICDFYTYLLPSSYSISSNICEFYYNHCRHLFLSSTKTHWY